jgi:hypothetical protein
LRLPKRTSLLPDLPRLKKFPRAELPATSLIGPARGYLPQLLNRDRWQLYQDRTDGGNRRDPVADIKPMLLE